ncbi:ABC transporter ATP-binding protein [Pseudomonadota bacterium]
MNNWVVRTSQLGKKYMLGESRASYQTLREVLTKGLSTPFRRLKRGTRETIEREEFWALKEVDLKIEEGEVLGIIGRNGAGKSTFLKLLAGITAPTTGRIELRGRIASLLEVGTGFHPELTGRENIFLNGAVLGMRRQEIKAKFDEIVAFADVEQFLDTPVKRYSSGMYVRLAFAVAAHLEPEILVVDEVLAVGDIAFQNKCMGQMGKVSKSGRTVLFVSHNMGAVQSLCTKAAFLERGRLLDVGRTGDIVNQYVKITSGEFPIGDLADRLDRTGGKELRLLSFDTLGSEGKAVPHLVCGEPFRISLRFKLFAPRKNHLRFGLSLKDRSIPGHLTELNSYYGSSESFGCDAGLHQFTFSGTKMPLRPGAYSINIIVTSGLEVLDWIADAGQINIIDGVYYTSGQMPLPGSYPLFFMDFECQLSHLSGSMKPK